MPDLNLPNHIAIIPDGNRRWAKKKKFQPWIGYQKGAESFEGVLERILELKIPYTTFWGGSWDNLTKRPKIEIKFLIASYKSQFERMIKDKRIHKNQVRINALGRWREILPKTTQQAIEGAIEVTKNYNQNFFTFFLAYDGTDEMIDCIKKIVKQNNPHQKTEINYKTIKENLWTKNLPPVDLVIRTGCQGDPHLSAGFMMWDTAYSQLYFTETLFPDFGPKDLDKALADYAKRQRRFGK
ncbi:MAG: polyprenyl diphosphate synthase [bacterium]|nr:polyprenyl diphosphate synthase [bacterium]